MANRGKTKKHNSAIPKPNLPKHIALLGTSRVIKSPNIRPSKMMKYLFSFIIALIGLIAAIYSLTPKISVSIGDRFDPDDALSTQIVVSNDSFYALYNLKLFSTNGIVNYSNGGKLIINQGGSLHTNGDECPRIGPGQKFTT
jgi:hypothetical protein